ncbi:GNAT family N-acetyltransferase [Paenibacillus koleovorans]|uniref:GNAT family N-acetyltransferase n=1 Tax=Paenibacillus koleovorans TaxID=121608 RepID=UPI000FDAB2E7|nr:GNAT family N-acetyltransferase [Paenibacillus koleovorans]
MNAMNISSLSDLQGDDLEQLTELLIAVVEDGASIGFLPPVGREEAVAYWDGVMGPDVVLLVARQEGRIVGTVQLHLCGKANGRHRAEIAKLMTAPACRRQGIGRLLMLEAEQQAQVARRTLLVLDTREGDPSNRLYLALGYVQAGIIPRYAMSANGSLDTTVLYYKETGETG